ncbi:MAG: GtrA family protein [Sphingomonas bacterium]|uniref:GtrA family protein n=1 Tax=Sphingomonas bacterium TaxID=1895847 RepID=UPI0026154E4E|nr:GtrA family protein [Sphingomonas bacterium]MDB5694641.1 GtrA family protein [Sphingomonas bacterium]
MSAATALLQRARALATKHDRPLRFVVAGAANTAFGLAIYPALLWSSAWLHEHYMVGLGIAQLVSLCFAYLSYKIAVFRTGGGARVGREIGLFSSFYLINYALNWLALPLLVRGLSLDPVVAQFGFAIVLMGASYFWHSRLTFRTRET